MNKKKLIPIISFSIGAILIIIAIVFSSPVGRGPIVSQEFDVDRFTGINIGGNHEVIWTESDEFNVRIEMQENLLRHMRVTVQNDILRIRSTRNVRIFNFGGINSNRTRIYIYSPSLSTVNFSGSVRAENWDDIYTEIFSLGGSGAATINLVVNAETLDIDTSGSARISVAANVETLYVDSNGASTFNLSGTTNLLDISGSGSTRINANDLQTTTANINISGAGRAYIAVSDYLNVRISGSGRVTYSGNPRISQQISGAGRVTSQ